MICLDTSFLIDLFKERIKISDKLKEHLKDNLVITPFSIFELYHGMYRLKRKEPAFNLIRRRENLKTLYNKFTILDFNLDAAVKSAEILNSLEAKGQVIDLVDIMITSIALVQNCHTIITRNVDHFQRISDLKIISYDLIEKKE